MVKRIARTVMMLMTAVVGAGCTAQPADPGDDDQLEPRCPGSRGTFGDQVLVNGDGMKDRAYWLYVPSTYICTPAAPMLVDFHGTSGDHPETAYQTPALIEFAEEHGVIVVRPRALPRTFNGLDLYQWDSH